MLNKLHYNTSDYEITTMLLYPTKEEEKHEHMFITEPILVKCSWD